MASIYGELSAFNAEAWVTLYQIDMSKFGQPNIYLHAGTNELFQPVVFQGITYQPFPIQVSGFEASSTSTARPTMTIANVTGLISSYVNTFDQLLGCKVARKRTKVKYLDAINFARKNALLWSEDATKSAWTKSNVTASASGVSSATGSAYTALIENTANTSHYVQQAVTALPSTTYTVSVVCKALGSGSNRQLRLYVKDNSGFLADNIISLANGSGVVAQTGTRKIEALGGGEYRVSVSVLTATTATSLTMQLYVLNKGQEVYAGDGVSGALITQMQVGVGDTVQPYQRVDATQNPYADPTQELPPDEFNIAQKTMENKYQIQFELAPSIDLDGVMLPKRQVFSNLCPWKYRGEECGYTGSAVADMFDSPTTDPAKDDCSRKISGCKLRYGEYGVLRFGAFVGSSLIRK